MDYKLLIAAILVLASVHKISGRVLTRCQLAQELLAQGISRAELPNWVCIAERESQGNTAKIRGPGWDGSYDYGLFLLSDNYWCAHGSRGKECMVTCEELLSDDITAVTDCAKQVYAVHGYAGWQSWGIYCRNKLPDLSNCFV